MNIEQIPEPRVEIFSEHGFLEKAANFMESDVVIFDRSTGYEGYGLDGYIQYLTEFVKLIPDLTSKVIDHQTYDDKLISRLQMQGKFTGTLQTDEGIFFGNGNPIDIEYQVEQEFNHLGKVRRLVFNYDLPEFLFQLSRRYRPSWQ